MGTENMNNVIQLVKECWWQIAILLAIPSIACVLAFTSWPFEEHPWAALSAIATFSAVFVALYIPQKDRKIREQKELSTKHEQARILLEEVLELAEEFYDLLNQNGFAYIHLIRLDGLRLWLISIRPNACSNTLAYLLKLKVIFFRVEKDIIHNKNINKDKVGELDEIRNAQCELKILICNIQNKLATAPSNDGAP